MNARRLARGLASAALLVSLITLASRLVGFGRWLAFSPTVGAGGVGTAYQSANQLPNVLFEVLAGGALTGAIVPLLAVPLARAQNDQVSRIASALLTWAITITLPVSILVAIFHQPLAGLLLSTGSMQEPGTTELAGRLLLMFSPQIVLYGIGAVLVGVLQSHRKFLWPAFVPLLSSLVVIGAYVGYWVSTGGAAPGPGETTAVQEAWLGWGTTLGVVAISIPLLLPTSRTNVKLRPTWSFPPGVAKRALKLAGAGMAGLLAQQAAVVTTLMLANRVGGTGSYVVFSYTQAVYLLPYAVLAVPLATVAFPKLSELATIGTPTQFGTTIAAGVRSILVAGFAGIVLLTAAALPLQEFFTTIDAAGANDAVPLDAMATAIVLMGLGLPGWALVAYLSRVCFAAEQSRFAAIGTSIGWFGAVAATLALVALFVGNPQPWITGETPSRAESTLAGLALGNALGMILAGVVLIYSVTRFAGRTTLTGVPRTLAVLVVGSLIAMWAGHELAPVLLVWFAGLGALASAVLAGILAAVVALAILALAVLAADRGILGALRQLNERPAAAPR